MSAQKPVDVEALSTPISVWRQQVQDTHPSLSTFYQTLLRYGPAENGGNCVAHVYGNNSMNADEQMAFAEKLVRAYNRDAAVERLIEKAEAIAVARWGGLSPAKVAALSELRAALDAVRGGAK